MVKAFEIRIRKNSNTALKELGLFFEQKNPVYHALKKMAAKLEELRIPYAVAGAMALNAHGFQRATMDVDLLVAPEGFKQVHAALEELGYVPPFKGSKQLRDTEHGVRIEFLVAGQFPGDGKPKPIVFPHPSDCAVVKQGISYVVLPKLIEMKLASGMTNPGRLKDLADVQELVRLLKLPTTYTRNLHPYVQEKFKELWQGVQQDTSSEH